MEAEETNLPAKRVRGTAEGGTQFLSLLQQLFLSAKVLPVGRVMTSGFATSRHVALGKSLPFSVPHVSSRSSRCHRPDGDRPVRGSHVGDDEGDKGGRPTKAAWQWCPQRGQPNPCRPFSLTVRDVSITPLSTPCPFSYGIAFTQSIPLRTEPSSELSAPWGPL